jgi:flagellar hook-associated protein 2
MSSTSSINSLLSSSTTSTQSVSLSSMLAAESGTSTAGIDVTSAVAAAIYADRAPERAWQADITTLSSQTTALTAIQTATEAIATDMQNLNTLTGPLAARTVTSSNSTYLTATAATGTAPGVHTVVITQPATAASWYSDEATSPTVTIPTSSLTITPATGNPVTIATGLDSNGNANAGDTLNDLATAINAADVGVTATVVSDTTGSRLAIVANSPGTSGGFTVTSSNYTGTSWKSPDIPTGSTLGANSVTLTSAAGTATIATTTGETYAQLATAINNATVATANYSTGVTTALTGATAMTPGSVTKIADSATGSTFTFTATATNTITDLNNAIAAAVTAGTLSSSVTGAIVNGQEVISEGATNSPITVTTNDSVLGTLTSTPGTATALGLTATAGSDANGTNLSIVSKAPSGGGTAPSFSINEPAFGFTQASPAGNAFLTVDGVPVSSSSNTVTGVIPGVTLSLLGSSLGTTIDLTVAPDVSQVSTALNQFVTDFNTAINLVNAQFNMSSSTSSTGTTSTTEGPLSADTTVVSLQSALEQAVNYTYTPPSGTTTTVSNLSNLGITVNNDGTLAVDTTTLDNALTTNSGDVQTFLEGSALNGFANSMYTALNTFTSPAQGAFTLDLKGIASSSTNLTTEVSNYEANYIAAQQTSLTADFSKAEIALQSLPQQTQELNSELGFTNKS